MDYGHGEQMSSAWVEAMASRAEIQAQLSTLSCKFMASDLRVQFRALQLAAEEKLEALELAMVDRRQLRLRIRSVSFLHFEIGRVSSLCSLLVRGRA